MRFALIYDFDFDRLICIQLVFSLSEYKPL